jgi:hypothetical protein
MDVADADRTQDSQALSDEDVAAALRTSHVAAVDPYTVEDAVPTSPALPYEDSVASPLPTADGTQEIHADDVLEILEGKKPLPPPAPVRPATSTAPRPVTAAERTQEIRAVDILEEVPVARASADIPIEVDHEPLEERRPTASSIAPLAIELESPVIVRKATPPIVEAASSASFVARIGPPRRLRLIVEISMAASLLILAAGALRAHFTPSEGDAAPIVLTGGDGTSRASGTAPPAAVDVKSLPTAATAPTTGTIARTTSAKLSVDGVAISGVSAMVPCGPHVIRVGTDKPRKVDVPCGGTLSLAPSH